MIMIISGAIVLFLVLVLMITIDCFYQIVGVEMDLVLIQNYGQLYQKYNLSLVI